MGGEKRQWGRVRLSRSLLEFREFTMSVKHEIPTACECEQVCYGLELEMTRCWSACSLVL